MVVKTTLNFSIKYKRLNTRIIQKSISISIISKFFNSQTDWTVLLIRQVSSLINRYPMKIRKFTRKNVVFNLCLLIEFNNPYAKIKNTYSIIKEKLITSEIYLKSWPELSKCIIDSIVIFNIFMILIVISYLIFEKIDIIRFFPK